MNTYSGGGGALQLYVPYSPTYGGNALQVRFGNYDVSSGNSWTSWKTLLASDNYTSYSPSLTGSGASGTWGINVTGNAATATNVAGLVQNAYTTYSNVAATTAKNGYYGLLLGPNGAYLNAMSNGSGGGFYIESAGVWSIYYNNANNCTGIGGSATASGYAAYTNGAHYVAGAITASGNVNASNLNVSNTNWIGWGDYSTRLQGDSSSSTLTFVTGSTERGRITSSGAWSFGSSGTATGTAGQVLTSAGAGAAPTWSNPSANGASYATIFKFQ